MQIQILPYVKLNGKTRYRVVYSGIELGQFYTRQNARRFIDREVQPLLLRLSR